MGIIRTEDRAARSDYLAGQQQRQEQAVSVALDELRDRLSGIIEEITRSARRWLLLTGSVSRTVVYLPQVFSAVSGNERAQELIKAAMLDVETQTSTVRLERDQLRFDPTKPIRLTVSFDPPLT
ncbi:Uncharacterised protein [Mycobacteroides abscessus subsp. abscessus]|uniref:hypothetical protein n=1 Tax=Mycobacteroides abscessus TaxID=36809 RepID=UPI000928D9C7|nr:hypothetical protein [Mycobacteroides abscessus]SHU67008.1 Uncharacterised protein [Mycobacteroides abscessus subsp. abscessus]